MMTKMTIFIILFAALVSAELTILPYPKYVEHGEGKIEMSRCVLSTKIPQALNEDFMSIFEANKDLILGKSDICSDQTSNKMFPITISQIKTEEKSECESEYYELDVNESGIEIRSECPVGLARAIATLWQLIKVKDVDRPLIRTYVEEEIISIEKLPITIKDAPRFPHRGVMIDTSRHFISMKIMKHIVDGLFLTKMSVFHWHISDDDSFPMYSKRIPDLASNAAFGPNQIYSLSDIAELKNYARNKGVRVIPEIDIPGHARALGLYKPLLDTITCFNSVWPFTIPDVYKIHGGPPSGFLDPTMDLTYETIEKLLADQFEYFEDSFIHLGGDEVIYSCWKSRPSIEEFMKKNNIPDYKMLMNYFIKRVRAIITRLNPQKKAIYWSNAASIELSYTDGDILQYWGYSKDLKTLESHYPNNKFILSPGDYLYLDCGMGNKYGARTWCGDYKTWLRMYMFEPESYGITPSKILGAEACNWAELVDDFDVDLRLWPRLAAMADTLWQPKRTEINIASVVKRLTEFSQNLNSQGFNSNAVTGQYCEVHPEECFAKYQ